MNAAGSRAARATLSLWLLLGGCTQMPGLDERAGSHVGRNVALVHAAAAASRRHGSAAGWQERSYPLANGHWVHVVPDRSHCEIHYEVNGDDIVVGYVPVGPGCRYR